MRAPVELYHRAPVRRYRSGCVGENLISLWWPGEAAPSVAVRGPAPAVSRRVSQPAAPQSQLFSWALSRWAHLVGRKTVDLGWSGWVHVVIIFEGAGARAV